MKIKLDENLPAGLVELLTACQHDVETVPSEALVGRDDATILAAAVGEGRLLMTQDLDFSDIRRFMPGTHPGLVLIRLRDPSRRRLAERLRQLLQTESVETRRACFVVIGDKKLRIRRPP